MLKKMVYFCFGATLALGTAAHAVTFTTGLTPNNGQRGIMFDVDTSTNALILESFLLDLYDKMTGNYELYYRLGGIDGQQNNAAAWALHDTLNGVTGTTVQQTVDFSDLMLPANSTIGLSRISQVAG
jgi:hypothetical protein